MAYNQEKTTKIIAQHFLGMFHESNVGMIIIFPDGRFHDVNEAFCRHIGYSKDEVLQLSIHHITHPDDKKKTREIFDKVVNGSIEVVHVDKRYVRKDGSVTWGRVSATWMRAEDGESLYSVAMIEDINMAKQAEQNSHAIDKRLRMLQSTIVNIATNEFVVKGVFQSATQFITKESAKALDVERASIWLFSADRQELRCIDLFEKSKKQHAEGLVLKAKDYPDYFKAVETGRVVDANNALSDSRTKEFADIYLKPNGIVSMLDAAIRVSGKIVGIVCHEHVGPSREWMADEISFAGEVADQMSQVLLNSDRNRAIEELRESEERFRSLADSAPVMIWVSGKDTLCSFFNKRWLDFVGRGLEQEIGKGWIQGVHEQDLEKCLETYLSAFKERREFEMEFRLRRYDGQYCWLLDKGIPRYAPEGEFQGYIGSCIDITESKSQRIAERKEAKEALAKSEEYNRTLFEMSPIGLALCKMSGELVDVNPAYAQIIGRTVEETLGLTYWEITPKKYEEDEQRQLASLKLTGRYGPYEKEYIHKGGHLVPVRLSGMILERGGEKYIWSSVEDITERKRYEEALKASETVLKEQKGALEQKNAALREILEQIEIEKKQIKEDIISNVELLLMPTIKKLKRKASRLDLKAIVMVEKNLDQLTSSFGGKVSDKKLKLTPREIEICNMVKNGLSSKEISTLLHVSFRTIEIHRNNIRKKLGIANKSINLTSYLQSF